MRGIGSELKAIGTALSIVRGMSGSVLKAVFSRRGFLATLAFLLLLLLVVNSGRRLHCQIQQQTDFLVDEFVIETHAFHRLQRATLRLSMTLSAEIQADTRPEVASETIALHVDLVQSSITLVQEGLTGQRFGIYSDEKISPDIEVMVADWQVIKNQVRQFEDNPDDWMLRNSILIKLDALEGQINQLTLSNNQQHWSDYETLQKHQQRALSFMFLVIGSFFLLVLLFVLYALRFARVRQQLLEEVAKASITDDLTQIYNRRYFNQVLPQAWNRMMRSHRYIALLMCDVDYFKRYNDRYGHQAGDECLHTIAQALSGVAHRAGEFVARYGGEEFALILPGAAPEAAARFAALLQTQTAQAAVNHQGSPVGDFVTISIGIAVGIPKSTLTIEAVLKVADEALYEAKAQGRNQFCLKVFNSSDLPQERFPSAPNVVQ